MGALVTSTTDFYNQSHPASQPTTTRPISGPSTIFPYKELINHSDLCG